MWSLTGSPLGGGITVPLRFSPSSPNGVCLASFYIGESISVGPRCLSHDLEDIPSSNKYSTSCAHRFLSHAQKSWTTQSVRFISSHVCNIPVSERRPEREGDLVRKHT